MGSVNKNGAMRDNNAKGGANGSKNNKGDGEKLITDARFAFVHSDPRFQTAPKHKSKVAIDSRFDRMFKDKSFSSSNTRIDKRGKLKMGASRNRLKDYYRIDEEEDEKRKKKVEKEDNQIDEESYEEEDKKRSKKVKKEDVEIHDESDEDKEDEEEEEKKKKRSKKKKRNKKVKTDEESEPSAFELKSKKELSESESESEDDDKDDDDNDDDNDDDDNVVESDRSSTTTTDSDEEDDVYSDEEETLLPEENVPEIDKETHRLAVVNMDWNQVKAVDLYVLLNSFLPKGGQIISVAVYPSEFGLKRMEEETVRGPVGLFDDDENKNGNDEDDDDDDEIDNEKLRAYELSRLRYYYAVVECDSIATSDYLYKACDGIEFERSSNKLDLRFIPDSMEFKHDPRDVATEAPPSYEGIDFVTRALQQSKVQLTWDKDEPHRSETLKSKFNAYELAKMERKDIPTSYESETDTEEESTDAEEESDNPTEDKAEEIRKKKKLYHILAHSGDGPDDEEEDDEMQEMEVTFITDLEDISKRILEKKGKKSETTWEAYRSKMTEKKKSHIDKSSYDSDRKPAEQPDNFFIQEALAPVSKKAGGKKVKLEKEVDEEAGASRAVLELLLADDNGETNLKGYNLKRKKGKEKMPAVDYEDPRFSSFLTSPLYALDPTDPQYKRSGAYTRQIAQKQEKADGEEMGRKEGKKLLAEIRLDEPEAVKEEQLKSEDVSSRKDKHELSSLVKCIKMKSKQVPSPSKIGKKVSGKRGIRLFDAKK